jgi:hypothetical protein
MAVARLASPAALPAWATKDGLGSGMIGRFETDPSIGDAFLASQASATVVGDSRSYRARTMRRNESSRIETRIKHKGQSKALYATVDFSKADPFTSADPSPFIGRRTDFLHSKNTLV